MLDDDYCEALYNYYKKTYDTYTRQFFSNVCNYCYMKYDEINPNYSWNVIKYVKESTYKDIRFICREYRNSKSMIMIHTFKQVCVDLNITNEIIIKFLLENV